MTGQGDDDVPRPWDGKPPPHYTTAWDFQAQQRDEEPGPPPEPPRRGPSRRSVAAIIVAVVVVVGAGLTLLFTAGSARGGGSAVASSRHPTTHAPSIRPPTPPLATSASPDPAAAYDVGSCFNEVGGGQQGKVELNLVPCGGSDSVFVINRVVASAAECDSGAGSADYRDHGYEVPDETANVAYCASLVVPVNSCFVLGGSTPITRATCGSAPDVVQVQSIETAPAVTTACTDKTDPDVWFYQAPTSGQFACVSRPAATATTTTPAG
jgi:hypothetical protein